jgi:hypothetical protein
MGPFGGAEVDDVPGTGGNIFVDPPVVDFGVFSLPAEPGDAEFAEATFSVYNAGDDPTVVHGQNDVVGSSAFHVQAPDSETLGVHEVVEYTVVFAPTVDDEYAGEISLKFGQATVELVGVAHGPRLSVDDAIGITSALGCVQEHAVRVENIGHEPLWLNPNDFSKEGPQYGVSWGDDSERWLDVGEAVELGVVFEPHEVGARAVEARIETNEPGDPIRTIAITATGVQGTPVVDSFQFATDLQMSILLVPDTRAPMATTLESMAASARTFVAALDGTNGKDLNDVNVAIVGGLDDVPCPTTAQAFYNTRTESEATIAAIAEGLTAEGAATGNLLDLAHGAVYEMGPSGCLAGFVRPTTPLHVVVISNGSEDSYSSATTYAQSIANQVEALGGSGAALSVFVPGGSDCAGDGCARLLDAAAYLNGTVWDLGTDDWNGTLGSYGASLVPLHAWQPLILSQRAEAASALNPIELWVGSGQIANDWYEYNSGLQAVMLDMAAPIAAGSVVDVSYLPAAVCE